MRFNLFDFITFYGDCARFDWVFFSIERERNIIANRRFVMTHLMSKAWPFIFDKFLLAYEFMVFNVRERNLFDQFYLREH